MEEITELVLKIQDLMINRQKTLAVAESCTGGLVSFSLTQIANSSQYFKGCLVAYYNEVKEEVLGVNKELLEQYGAVSSQVSKSMASGVKNILRSDIGISTTGIAGPGGGSLKKPVGLVYIGLASGEQVFFKELRLNGSRQEIRQNTCKQVLKFLYDYLNQ